jgi:acetyl esterase/lipase
VRCAIRWLRSQASSYSINSSRVALIGGSAGGHLASLVAVAGDPAEFDGECPAATQSARVSGVVSIAGPSDLRASAYGSHEQGQWFVDGFLGGMASEKGAEAERASPIVYLDSSDPPILLTHATQDSVVPISESRNFKTALDQAGIVNALVEVTADDHNFSPLLSGYQQASCTIVKFFETVLR